LKVLILRIEENWKKNIITIIIIIIVKKKLKKILLYKLWSYKFNIIINMIKYYYLSYKYFFIIIKSINITNIIIYIININFLL
jgi:hypothetical protein